jgi:uncharacterized SAM-binding protein YcdF (DUF218 family)
VTKQYRIDHHGDLPGAARLRYGRDRAALPSSHARIAAAGRVCGDRGGHLSFSSPTAAAELAVTPFWRLLHRAAIGAAGIGLFAAAGLVWFAIAPTPENRALPTDAIVVLTGGSLRLQSGIDLLREGKGRELFVSGVNQAVDLEELLRVSGHTPNWLSCCIAIGHEAENTEGNALETARWMRRHRYHSLRLVTAWYHLPRSCLEFERAMPDIDIVPHPVFPERVKQGHWWAWRGTAVLLIGEYGKYLAALLRPVMERPQTGAPDSVEAEIRQ